jgi:hypothetical protein
VDLLPLTDLGNAEPSEAGTAGAVSRPNRRPAGYAALMSIPTSPLPLLLVIALSLVSSGLLWTGMRHRQPAHLLWGFGLGLPTFDVENVKLWIAGAVLCAIGAWIHKQSDGF